MTKTLPPGTVELPEGTTFVANVVPDVFDERDLEYRPRLTPLPAVMDVRPGDGRHVLLQDGNSCTGHAVAAMVNTVLAATGDSVSVSPYMLYRMARRYDEWEGEEDEGSSLRGALKGWYYHGVLPTQDWPSLDSDAEPDLATDPELAAKAMRRPLGAFFRVNAFRLDDMQSAVTELNGIVASAAVHEGWVEPVVLERDGTVMHVIDRPPNAQPLGGHAFAIVGYNEVGFLVQNSWGTDWGRGGFATLPYDDWLASAYDAWVARPGVYSVVSSREHSQVVTVTGGGLASGPGPDLVRLAHHVVNLANEGRLSTNGRFTSSPTQVHRMCVRMREWHEHWRGLPVRDGESPPPRRVVLYAHGGLNNEGTGLEIAQKQLNWWLNNGVYPVTFAWQSGPGETLLSALADSMTGRTPAGGLGFDLVEQFDRLVEKVARARVRWMWDEMKENALAASAPLPQDVQWPQEPSAQVPRAYDGLPGASLFVDRLAAYADSLPDGERLELHLVGHSAGSIFLSGLVGRLAAAGLQVESLTLLAAAIRLDDFGARVLPHLESGFVRRFAAFGLSDRRELDDVCGAGPVAIYQKSLLYLISRALERGTSGKVVAEVPLLGMQRFLDAPLGRSTMGKTLTRSGRALVWSPNEHPTNTRTSATRHGDFDDNPATMTSVMLRVLDRRTPDPRHEFVPHTPLLDAQPLAGVVASGATHDESLPVDRRPVADVPAGVGEGEVDAGVQRSDVEPAGAVPVDEHAPAQPAGVQVPGSALGRPPEQRIAPESGSELLDVLARQGWSIGSSGR